MRSATFLLLLPLAGCANDYPSPYGRSTTSLAESEGGRGLWTQPYINPIGATDVQRTYYARLPAYAEQKKPVPQVPKALKSQEELAQEEAKLKNLREGTKVTAQKEVPSAQQAQKNEATLAALRDKTRARAAAEAAE